MGGSRGPPPKGWVRDGILSCLARGPTTGAAIADELGVSRATVSYHTKALLRRDMIEIADVRSVRGGVYSKTYALRSGAIALARRKDGQESAVSRLDEVFERLLMSWHLEPKRRPSDEIMVFLYHAFRLLARADSLEDRIFEEFGRKVGTSIVSPRVKSGGVQGRARELSRYLEEEGMARLSLAADGNGPALVCTECFENKDYGGLVCSFTKGVLEGAMRPRLGGNLHVERADDEMTVGGGALSGCRYALRTGRVRV